MYELRIERIFHAAHALRLYDGMMEQPHAHDWRVYVHVVSGHLDSIEVVMDFHALERIVDSVLAPLHKTSLNEHPAFKNLNPSAERVAEVIFKQIAPQLPAGVLLSRLTVTEAPGCQASYLSS